MLHFLIFFSFIVYKSFAILNAKYKIRGNKMKKLLLAAVLMCAFSFARVSTYHVVVVSPVESYIQKKQVEISKADHSSDSVQWKRRYKRRRKVRRPQRGR